MRACLVQGSQQIWVAALWYWGNSLDGVKQGNMAPWWIVTIVWPLSVMSFIFVYLLLYGLPGKLINTSFAHYAFSQHVQKIITVNRLPRFPTSSKPCSGAGLFFGMRVHFLCIKLFTESA